MKKNIIIGILIVVGIISSLVGINYFENKKSLVNKRVIDKDSKNTFAIYLSNGSGGYTESQSNSIPSTGYVLNFDRSMCLDLNGEVVDNVLNEPVQGKIEVYSNKTLSCYLYYDEGYYVYWNTNYDSTRYLNNTTLVNNNHKIYIKTLVVGSNDVSSQACGIFGGVEYCLSPNTWDNAATIKSEMEALGATCNSDYSTSNYLTCVLDSVSCRINSSNFPLCRSGEQACRVRTDNITGICDQ